MKAKIHNEKKHKTKKTFVKMIKGVYIIAFYIAAIWAIETRFDASLFVKLASLYGVIVLLTKISTVK